MIIISSELELNKQLDESSYIYIIELMQNDPSEYSSKGYIKEDGEQWIGRVLLMSGSNHNGSQIKFGFLLRYQFKKIKFGFEVGIKQLKIAESHDDFLDLYNEVARNPEVFNVQYQGK